MSYTWRRKLARLWRKAEVMEQEFLAEAKKICKNADASQSGLIFGHEWVAGFTKSSQVPDDEDVFICYTSVVAGQDKSLDVLLKDANATCDQDTSGEYAMIAAAMDYVIRTRMDCFLSRLQGNEPRWLFFK